MSVALDTISREIGEKECLLSSAKAAREQAESNLAQRKANVEKHERELAELNRAYTFLQVMENLEAPDKPEPGQEK